MERSVRELSEDETTQTTLSIGDLPISVRCASGEFIGMLEEQYRGFVARDAPTALRLDVEIVQPRPARLDDELAVAFHNGVWVISRGDFSAHWNPETGRGHVRQSMNPYSIDSLLRIIHSLALASCGGFLVHAASVLRDGRSFVMAGKSGAGKTTIARLAPPDVTLLTDEISYLRPLENAGYRAFGTPFAGELETSGQNVSAPVAALFLLEHGRCNAVAPVPAGRAISALLRNVLFFAADANLVQRLFHAACELVSAVPVYALTFQPDAAVWDLIR